MTDLEIAERYIRKSQQAADTGKSFTLTFTEFKRLMLLKRCEYSGVEFSSPGAKSKSDKWCSRTLDRVDNSLGYISGNVKAVCHGVNSFKSSWENPQNPLTEDVVHRIMKNIAKVRKK